MQLLQTDRLILRRWLVPDDLNDFYEYAKDPDTGIHAGWKPHESIEESREILEMLANGKRDWAVCERHSGKVIGSIGLSEDTKRHLDISECRELGYVLSKDYWGQGLMTEAVKEVLRFAFEKLGLNLVTVYHYPYNDRSRRVIEKAGFTYEGTLRMVRRRYDGVMLDSMCYSITKEEYRKQYGEER